MRFHAPSGGFILAAEELRRASDNARYALRNIRRAAGLPLTPYPDPVCLTPAEHAQRGVLDAMKSVGVDMGAEWGHQLDLTEQ